MTRSLTRNRTRKSTTRVTALAASTATPAHTSTCRTGNRASSNRLFMRKNRAARPRQPPAAQPGEVAQEGDPLPQRGFGPAGVPRCHLVREFGHPVRRMTHQDLEQELEPDGVEPVEVDRGGAEGEQTAHRI